MPELDRYFAVLSDCGIRVPQFRVPATAVARLGGLDNRARARRRETPGLFFSWECFHPAECKNFMR